MDTTTPDGGAQVAQPTTTEAVTTGYNADQVITTDNNGTPELAPVTSASESTEAPAAPVETPSETPQAQAEQPDSEIIAWAEKKGLSINPENPNEIKLARMQLETDRKFHESRQIKSNVQPPETLPAESPDPAYNALIDRQNETELKLYVRDWFEAVPEAKQHRAELQKISLERPHLTNMDDVYAHFLANPSRSAELKQQGGKEALENLAQKQQQIPPGAAATNTGVYDTQTITPRNVSELVDRNDQAWFEKNHAAISKALSGQQP